MHSQSLCNCYCKTRVPIARQRVEVHSERSHARGTKCFTPKFAKADSSRSAKKRVPLIPARVIDDEQLDTKRSTVTFPVSPILSPETSAVIEDVEKLIGDAQIRMKEINMTASGGRFRKRVNLYPDEASLDDENDQLLYIRERVACKFQEANGWIDATAYSNARGKEFSKEEYVAVEPKRIIDLHASKFKTVDDRYGGFSRQRKLEVEKFECTNDEGRKINDQPPSTIKKIEKNKRIVACSMQTGLSVDIKGALRVENLEEIHISPDPSFVHENQNVATYIVCRDFDKGSSSPRRRKKFVKILEDNGDNDIDRKSTNETMKRRNTKKNRDEIRNGPSCSEIISEECRDVFAGANEEFVENDERVNEVEKPAVFQNEKYLETTVSNVSDYCCGEKKSSNGNDESIKQDVEVRIDESNVPTMKIVDRNEQRQVRFDERALETGNGKNSIDSRGKEVVVELEQDLVMQSISNNLKYQTVSKDNTERFEVSSSMKEIETKNERVPLPGKEIDEKRINNKKRYKEVCVKRKAKKDERNKMIDERFANIVQTYCQQYEKCAKMNGSVISSTSMNSTEDSEDSEDSDDLYNLYEPSTNQLDNVLISYNKMIDNVVRSTKTIDEYLSRPEMKQYYAENTIETEGRKKKLIVTSSQSRKKIEKPKTSNLHHLQAEHVTELRIEDSIIHDRSSATNSNWDFKNKQVRGKRAAPFRKSVIIKEDDESRAKGVVSKNSDNVELNVKMKDRVRVWRELSMGESTESSETNNEDGCKIMGTNDGKGIRFRETRSFPGEKDSSTVTTSSVCPLSSSSEIRTANDTKLSLEFSKSTIKDDAANLILNIESEMKNIVKDHFDRRTFRNVVCSSVLKRICPEAKNTEQLIARVVREETRFMEDKMRNMFNVDEIVGLIVKSLLENLRGERSNFVAKDFGLLIGENIPVGNVACANSRIIEAIETAGSSGDFEKFDLQIECLESEENCSRTETIKRDEVVEKLLSNRSDRNSKNQFALISKEKASRYKNENSPIEKDDVELHSAITSLDENNHGTSRETCDEKNSVEIGEKIISVDNKQSQIEGNDKEMLDFLIDRSQVITEHIKNKECKTTDIVDQNDFLKKEYKIVDDGTKKREETEDALQRDFSIFKQNLSSAKNTITITEERKEKSVDLCSFETKGKAAEIVGSNSSQASSSDSLRDCASLRSNNSNNVELSQEVDEIKQISEMRNAVDDRVTNTNNSCFDNTFAKKQILLNVYDEVHRKFLSSTFETNYSSVLNQQFRLSNGVSTISTIESNKIDMSSDTSHSEGELCFPSSGSYSLGEIRILEKNRSEGENTDDLDDNIAIFVTKEMLTSWNESSKSLVQSMGEI